MKMHSLKCPECGANLEVEKSLKVLYCKYCGHKILVEDHSLQDTITKIRFRKFERDENIVAKKENAKLEREKIKLEQQKLKQQEDFVGIIILLILFVIVFLFKPFG